MLTAVVPLQSPLSWSMVRPTTIPLQVLFLAEAPWYPGQIPQFLLKGYAVLGRLKLWLLVFLHVHCRHDEFGVCINICCEPTTCSDVACFSSAEHHFPDFSSEQADVPF